MKLDKIEKNRVIGLTILVAIAIVSTIFEQKKAIRNPNHHITYINETKSYDLPEDIRELSENYQAYTDLYKSDKLTLVYSYTSYKSQLRDKDFHKELSEKLANENFDIETVIYKDWHNDTFEIQLKNKDKIKNPKKGCGPTGDDEKQLGEFIDISQHCINNVCLVDVKNHKYTLISPKVDYIIETIKDYKQ